MGRKLNQPVDARSIAQHLGLRLLHGNCQITAVQSLAESTPGGFCFAKSAELAAKADPDCLLLTTEAAGAGRTSATILTTEPRLDFARVLEFLDRHVGFVWSDVPALVHPSARIGRNVVLGNGVEIGPDTVILHNVVIGAEVKIGSGCVIKSCAVIGEDGFGFERQSNGRALRLPHIGNVVIGDNVEIGSLTTVCRGTLGNTVVLDGVKIDDHVHIAHNVHIDPDAFVIACAEISGGVRVGARSWIAPNAAILNQLTIGEDAVVGLGAVVVKSVPVGTVVAGNPAKPLVR